jgi:hypothetical protein
MQNISLADAYIKIHTDDNQYGVTWEKNIEDDTEYSSVINTLSSMTKNRHNNGLFPLLWQFFLIPKLMK